MVGLLLGEKKAFLTAGLLLEVLVQVLNEKIYNGAIIRFTLFAGG
jgi:hypothetical protein